MCFVLLERSEPDRLEDVIYLKYRSSCEEVQNILIIKKL